MGANLLRIGLIALAYCLCGMAAIRLALPPSVVAPIFPSAGIALAAVLVYGRQGLLASLLGAFALNLLQWPALPGAADWWVALGVLAAVGTQALCGAWLLRRWTSWPQPPDSVGGVLGLIAAVLLSSLIGASGGLGSLALLRPAAETDWAFAWWNWWAGDFSGVLVGLPLSLLLMPQAPGSWRSQRFALGLPLVVATLLMALLYLQFSRWEEERLRAQFEALGAQRVEALKLRLRDSLVVLEAARLYLKHSVEVTREEFHDFATPWFQRSPQILAIGQVARLAPGSQAAFEAARRAEGWQGFTLHERGEGRVVSLAQDEQWVIAGVEPLAGNEAALGLRLDTSPAAATLRQTLVEGSLGITPAFRLAQMAGDEHGIVLYAPVRPERLSPGSGPVQSAAAFVAVHLSRLVERPDRRASVCLIARTQPPMTLLASAAGCAEQTPGRYHYEQVEVFAERVWVLRAVAGEEFLAEARGRMSWVVRGLCSTLMALLLSFLLVSNGRTRRVEALVARRTAELESVQRRTREMLDGIELAAVQLDRNGCVTYCNPYLARLLGFDAQRLVGMEWFELALPVEESAAVREVFRCVMTGNPQGEHFQNHIVTRSGERRLIAWSNTLLHDEHGQAAGTASIGEDISARYEAEAEREKAWSLLNAALEQSPAGILVVDAHEKRPALINSAALRMRTGRGGPLLRVESQNLAQGWQVFLPDGSPCEAQDLPLVRALRHGQATENRELIVRDELGHERWVSVNAAPVRAASGEVVAGVLVFTDISQIKEQQSHLEHLAHFDALTRLPNRVLLADRLEQAIASARRRDSEFALAYLDLDGFKEVNDHLGHACGDRLLVEVAARLRSCLRGEDTVARLGGDEFVLLLTELGEEGLWRPAVDRVIARLVEPMILDGQQVQVSASIGVTLFPRDDATPEVLLRHADQAMYEAKQAGRNRAHLFDPELDRRTRSWQACQARLEAAVGAGELELHYQPRINLASGRIEAVEALLRWRHPESGLLMPGQFLPVAEGTPLICHIGRWVIDAALAQAQTWARGGLDLIVAINLAPEQLQEESFFSDFEAALKRHPDLPSGRIECEIVESAALDDVQRASHIIRRCAQIGVRFALDDFGTGYSSLAYFRRLPAEVLKIDQSFIRDMLVDSEDLAIVEGIIGLARVFNRSVVAEGVESIMHGVLLRHLGCERAQGYGIARPMPAGALPGWMAAWRPDPVWSCDLSVLQREDVPLLAAEAEHRNWVERIVAVIAGGREGGELPQIDRRECRLGRWLSQAHQGRHSRNPSLGHIAQLHERMHDHVDALATGHGESRDCAGELAELEACCDELFNALRALWLAQPA